MSVLVLRSSQAAQGGTFPLSVHASGRYLVQNDATPFPILGRASWGIIGLDATSYQAAIADVVAKGFTAIEFRAPDGSQQDNFVPLDGASNLPFTTRIGGGSYTSGDLAAGTHPDFTTPNEAYWVFLDTFIAYCETQGIYVLWFPSYIGNDGDNGSTEGWGAAMKANGTTKMQTYGAYVANRYKARKNILWMLVGDVDPDAIGATLANAHAAFVTGLKSVSGQQSTQYCAENESNSYGGDSTIGTELTLHGAYSFQGNTVAQMRAAYAAGTTKPAFLLEEPYDEEGSDGTGKNGAAQQPTRSFVFRAVLEGPAGYMEGNGYIIHYKSIAGGYASHFSTTTQTCLASFNAWYKLLPWHRLVPNGQGSIGTLLTGGTGGTIDTNDYVSAACTPEGDLLLAYLSLASGNPTIDMTKMRGTTTCIWIDPKSGATQSAGGPFANTGTRTFTDPGNNSDGEGDWFLKLTA